MANYNRQSIFHPPQGRLRLRDDFPWRGKLRTAVVPSASQYIGQNLVDLAGGPRFGATSTAGPAGRAYSMGQFGRGHEFANNTAFRQSRSYAAWRPFSVGGGYGPYTQLFYGERFANPSGVQVTAAAYTVAGGTSGDTPVTLMYNDQGDNSMHAILVMSNGGTVVNLTATNPTRGQPFMMAFVSKSQTSHEFVFWNVKTGYMNAATSSSNVGTATGDSVIELICNDMTGSGTPTSTIGEYIVYGAFFLEYGMSRSEVYAWFNNPFLMVEPEDQRRFYLGGLSTMRGLYTPAIMS